MNFKYPIGSTPIDSDELKGLIPKHIETQEELNAWESENILQAKLWVSRIKKRDIVSVEFIKELHGKMFDKTWAWAGKFRTSDKNIGVAWAQVGIELKKLCDDVSFWIEHQVYDQDEIAVRFHHKLVEIHPFSNGNGRFARLMADLLITQLGKKSFSWGSNQNLIEQGKVRSEYIKALKSADQGKYEPLLLFARS